MLKKFIEAMTIFVSSCFAFILVTSSVLLVYSFVIEQVKNSSAFPGLILGSVIVAAWCTHDCVLDSNK